MWFLRDEKYQLSLHWPWFAIAPLFLFALHAAARYSTEREWHERALYNFGTLPDLLMDDTHSMTAAGGAPSSKASTHHFVRTGTLVMMVATAVGSMFFRCAHSSVLLARRFLIVHLVASFLCFTASFGTLLPATTRQCLSYKIGGTYEQYTPTAMDADGAWRECAQPSHTSAHTLLMVQMWLTIELVFVGYTTRWRAAESAVQRAWCTAQGLSVWGARVKLVLYLYHTIKSRSAYTGDVLTQVYFVVLVWSVAFFCLPTSSAPSAWRKEYERNALECA